MNTTQASSLFPLYVESHPEGYEGPQYMSFIVYRPKDVDVIYAVVIDRITDKEVLFYDFNRCSDKSLTMDELHHYAKEWYFSNPTIPFSIFLIQRMQSTDTCKAYSSLPLKFVKRIVGPTITFNLHDQHSHPRRYEI